MDPFVQSIVAFVIYTLCLPFTLAVLVYICCCSCNRNGKWARNNTFNVIPTTNAATPTITYIRAEELESCLHPSSSPYHQTQSMDLGFRRVIENSREDMMEEESMSKTYFKSYV